jgi:hypothetical protein
MLALVAHNLSSCTPMMLQVGVTSAKLQITAKDLAASQLLAVQQAGQLQQQGQALSDLSSRCKQLEQQLAEAQQQVRAAADGGGALGISLVAAVGWPTQLNQQNGTAPVWWNSGACAPP